MHVRLLVAGTGTPERPAVCWREAGAVCHSSRIRHVAEAEALGTGEDRRRVLVLSWCRYMWGPPLVARPSCARNATCPTTLTRLLRGTSSCPNALRVEYGPFCILHLICSCWTASCTAPQGDRQVLNGRRCLLAMHDGDHAGGVLGAQRRVMTRYTSWTQDRRTGTLWRCGTGVPAVGLRLLKDVLA